MTGELVSAGAAIHDSPGFFSGPAGSRVPPARPGRDPPLARGVSFLTDEVGQVPRRVHAAAKADAAGDHVQRPALPLVLQAYSATMPVPINWIRRPAPARWR